MGNAVSCLCPSHRADKKSMRHYTGRGRMCLEAEKSVSTHNEEAEKTFTVLVTGMGAFPRHPGSDDGHFSEDDNCSHAITKLLPSHLPPFSKFNPTCLTIRVLNPTRGSGQAVKSEYGNVRTYCQKLWKQYGNSVDLIVHLGLADGWEWYTVERSAWKEGTVKAVDGVPGGRKVEYYMQPDDIGQTIKDLTAPSPWTKEVPERLFAMSGINIDKLAKNVQRTLNSRSRERDSKQIEVRPHPDAGDYLCGFISYESFAQAFVNGYSSKAIFCHVPGWRDRKRLQIGRDFVCSLVGEIAAQEKSSSADSL